MTKISDKKEKPHTESLFLGVIQTVIDPSAWGAAPKMSVNEERNAVSEITERLGEFKELTRQPDIILMPELSIPLGLVSRLERMAEQLGSIIIGGLDYRKITATSVTNEAVIIIPSRRGAKKTRNGTIKKFIGKTYPAPREKELLEEKKFTINSDPIFWIFDGGDLGVFGVAICYDFLDLERAAMYRGKIQHLFILAYNRDLTSFYNIAETLARVIYCNVAICNTGFHGGSLVVSPYYKPYNRTIYRHEGRKLSTAQAISLPVQMIKNYQDDIICYDESGDRIFKHRPPGFSNQYPLAKKGAKIN